MGGGGKKKEGKEEKRQIKKGGWKKEKEGGVRGRKDDKRKELADLPVWGETRSRHVGAADGLDLLYVLEVAFIQQLHSANKHITLVRYNDIRYQVRYHCVLLC